MIRSKDNYEDKINFLKILNIDFWVTKPIKISYKNKIFVSASINKKHKKLIESFQKNTRKFEKSINFETFDKKNDIEINTDFEEKSFSKYFILCDASTKSLLVSELQEFEKIYKNKSGNEIFIFNTLFESDNITNEIKKLIWADFQFFTKYE